MPSTGKVFVRPGCLAKKLTSYEIEREKQIQKNAAVMKSYGIMDTVRDIQMATTKKVKSQFALTDDGEYVPPTSEDGLSSSESDDGTEVAPTRGTKRKLTFCPLQENTSDVLPTSPPFQENTSDVLPMSLPKLVSSTQEATLSQLTLVTSTQVATRSPPVPVQQDEANGIASVIAQANGIAPVIAQAKKGRGRTSGKWLRQFSKHNGPDAMISVPVHEEMNALCGDDAGKAARLLGMHIRRLCPIRDTPHWQDVNPGTQAAIIQAVLDHCNISENYHSNPQAQKIVNTKCYLLHKDWWGKMKQHYRKVKKAGENVYSKPYDGVTPDDWKYMIDGVWKTDNHKKRSKAGKANRKQLQYNHTSGSRSFVAAMTSKDAPSNGDGELDFPEFFKKTHQNKKEQWISPLCEQKHAQMLTLRDESLEENGEKLTAEDFSTKVLGVGKKKQYLRGFGIGPKPSQFSNGSAIASQPRDDEVEKLRAELVEQNKEREKEREQQQRKFEEQETKLKDQERKMEEQQMKFEEQQRKFEEQRRQFEEQQNRMANIQTLVGQLLQDRQQGINK